jgi:hypothetical protein
MTNRFMVSVAALSLIAGTGLANAQGMKGGEAGGSSMQHSAPSSSSAAPSQSESTPGASSAESSPKSETKGDTKGEMKSTQSEQKSPGAMKNQRAEDNAKDKDNAKGGSTNQRAEERTKGSDTNKSADERTKGGDTNMKAEGRQDRNGNNTAETKGERSQTTTGQAGAGAKLSTDQRTKITTVIRNEHVTSVDHVNFDVRVGTRVPREGVEFRPLPAEVVTIYPEWRGYEFIVVHNQIVVVDPNTYEIVEIIES